MTSSWGVVTTEKAFDELRSAASAPSAPLAAPSAIRRRFFDALGGDGAAGPELAARAARVQRRVHEDGATYNVRAEAGGASREWPLQLLPFIVDADEWGQIVRRRADEAVGGHGTRKPAVGTGGSTAALLRSMGLAARNVSGYLSTQQAPGQPRLVGSDASHAWVSVWCPLQGWVDFDPTNCIRPALDHVTVAWGRDYGDVAPLRGVIRGGSAARPQVQVSVEPV
ncbi:MAG TPA: transglutaminase domain-containing protein [Burkholderiaceae bacterium]